MRQDERGRSVAEATRRLVDAWNRRDAHAFGNAFAPDAEYVTGAGRRVRGREGIAALVDSSPDPSRVSVVDGPIVEIVEATATVRFGWSAAGEGSVARRGTITCTLTWHGTGWLVDALRNEESG